MLNLFKVIFDTIPDFIIILNRDYEVIRCNVAGYKYLGLARENLEGKKCFKIFDRNTPCENCAASRVYETKKFARVKRYVKETDKWLDIRAYPILDDSGDIFRIIEYVTDITEQQKADDVLRESEEKYRLITEKMRELVSIINEKYVFEYINEKTHEKILGYLKDDLIGKNISKFIHPDDLKTVIEALKKGTKKGEGMAEIRFKHKNGRWVWLHTIGNTYIDQNRNPRGLLISRDMTERKEAEQKLKESEEKFRTITEQSVAGIIIIQDDLIKYVNHRMEELFGYTIEEIQSWKPGEFLRVIHPDYQLFVAEQARKKQMGLKDIITQYPIKIVKKNGENAWLENYSKTVTYKGKPAILGIQIDITEKKEAEQKLIESEEKYREAYNLAEFYKDLFVHDITNILQNILSSIELGSFYSSNPDQVGDIKKIFTIIKDQVNQGANLVTNVRKLSTLEEKGTALKSIEILQFLEDSIEFIRIIYPDRKINVHVDAPDKKIHVRASDLILNVFENLLINAVRHNEKANVEIIVRITKEQEDGKNYVKMEFMDNGLGVEDIRKIEIFQREIKKVKNISGIGLGLLLVKRIIDSYNGIIWVEDKVKGDHTKGSNFILLIPEID